MADEGHYAPIEKVVQERKVGDTTQVRVRWAQASVTKQDLDKYGGNLRSKFDRTPGLHTPVFARGFDPDLDLWINQPCADSSRWRIVAVLGMEVKNGLVRYQVRWEDNWVDKADLNDLARKDWRNGQAKHK